MKSKKIIFLLASLLLVGCDNADIIELPNNDNNATNNTTENNTVKKCEHNFVKYDEVLPSYFYDGYVAHYKCSKCDALKDVNNQPTTSDAIKLEKAGDSIGLSVNGAQKGTFTLIEKDDNGASWKIENVDVKVNDVLSINKPGDLNYKYFFFGGGNLTEDNKSKVEGTYTINLSATPNGFYLDIYVPTPKALVVKVNENKYPLTQVNYYQSETQTYIYGYHNFAANDVMVIDDEINNQIYNYLDLADDTKWNIYDFHKGTNNEIIFDVAGRYGIEFSRGGDKKISITKSFAPANEGDFDVEIFNQSARLPLLSQTIAPNTSDYESFSWYVNHEAIINAEDNKAAIANGVTLYLVTSSFQAGAQFRIANVTDENNITYLGANHLVSVMADENAVSISMGYFKINTAGTYTIMYAPSFDSIYIQATQAPLTSSINAVIKDTSLPLTPDSNNVVTISSRSFQKNDYISYYSLSGTTPSFIHFTLDSSVDSTIATLTETDSMTLLYILKPGIYTIELNLTTHVLKIIDETPEPISIDPTHNLTFTLSYSSQGSSKTVDMVRSGTDTFAMSPVIEFKQGDMVMGVTVTDYTINKTYDTFSNFMPDYDTSLLTLYDTGSMVLNIIKQAGSYSIGFELTSGYLSISKSASFIIL